MSRDRWRPKRRRLVLVGTFLGVTALALVWLRMSPPTSQGAGISTLDGLVAVVNISLGGACDPGNLAVPVSAGAIAQTPVPTPVRVTGTVAHCISRAGCPETLVIQDDSDPSKVERFSYANVSALTGDTIDGTTSSFPLHAVNLPPPPDPASHCLGQADFPNSFPQNGQIFIDHELFHYSSIIQDSQGQYEFQIDSRAIPPTTAATHGPDSLIRSANQIELLGRGVPKYPAVSYTTPTPTFAAHSTGDSVRSPKTYNTCRVTLSQPSPPAGAVTATSKCYFIQEPGYTEDLCATPLPAPARTACFWPLGRVPAPYPQQGDQSWVSTSVTPGPTTTIALVANVQPSINYCFPYLEGLLWAKEQMTLTLTKTGNTGTFAINVYTNDQCTGTPAFALTDGAPNVVARIMPSSFLQCAADVQQSGKTLDGRALCYLNSPGFVTNKPGAGGLSTCPSADPKFCGDGIYNDPPPGCAQDNQATPVACKRLPAATPTRHDCAGRGTSPDPVAPCDVSQYQYLHVDTAAHIQGTLNNSTNKFELHGCLEDPNGKQALGAVYVELLSIDSGAGGKGGTGEGSVTVWLNQTNANCVTAATNHSTVGLSGTSTTMGAIVFLQDPSTKPASVTSTLTADIQPGDTSIPLADGSAFPTSGGGGRVLIGSEFISYAAKSGNTLTSATRGLYGTTAVMHSSGALVTLISRGADTTGPCTPSTCRDSDSDGCYDKDELWSTIGTQTALDAAKQGSMRDPQNPFDFPDVTTPNLHSIDVADIVYVVNRFRHDMNLLPVPASSPYDPKADHTIISGNNPGETWHLGPPNGQIDVGDIVAVVNSYNHKCK